MYFSHGILSDVQFLLSGVKTIAGLKTIALQMGASLITPNGSVKVVIFDKYINMYEHITSVCCLLPS